MEEFKREMIGRLCYLHVVSRRANCQRLSICSLFFITIAGRVQYNEIIRDSIATLLYELAVGQGGLANWFTSHSNTLLYAEHAPTASGTVMLSESLLDNVMEHSRSMFGLVDCVYLDPHQAIKV